MSSRISLSQIVLHNLDAALALLALPLFALTGLPLAAWFWATVLWGANRFLQSVVERRASAMGALRAVGVLGASMLLRPWVGMLVLFLITRHHASEAVSAVLLFLLLVTVDIVTRVVTHRNIRPRVGGAH
ncbi:MAG: hypothetical protein ACXVY5_01375 [Gaiellales bacterium]